MIKSSVVIIVSIVVLSLGGCPGFGIPQTAFTTAGGPSGISSTAAGVFGIPAATSASQVSAEISQLGGIAAQLQMLKAQLDGVPMPALPPIVPMGGSPTTVPIVPSGGPVGVITTGPVVTTPSPIVTPTPVPMPTPAPNPAGSFPSSPVVTPP